jgi:hypothetical protein
VGGVKTGVIIVVGVRSENKGGVGREVKGSRMGELRGG